MAEQPDRSVFDMSDNDAMIEAVIVDMSLTADERAAVLQKLAARGYPPNENGKVPSRLFVLEAREVLAEREQTSPDDAACSSERAGPR